MKTLLLALAASITPAACASVSSPPTSPPPRTTQPASVTAPPPAAQDDALHLTVRGDRYDFAFHASRFSSLAYQLDCLSGIISCSKEAYEALWKDELGGLSDQDRASLKQWASLKFSYRGQAERVQGNQAVGSGLPLLPAGISVGRMMRLIGYRAESEEQFAADLGLYVHPADIDQARSVLHRFQARYDPFWRRSAPVLRTAMDGYVALMEKDLAAVVERVGGFYGADLPLHTEIAFQLMARSAHPSESHGELVGSRSLVEVLPGESPAERIFVVLHELFHYLHWSAKRSDLAALATRILDLDDPIAMPAYALMDEVLATTFGSGTVQRIANRPEYDKRVNKVGGMYGEEFIDAGARAVLREVEAYVAEGRTIHDPAFVPRYVNALRRAFPDGIAPRAFVRNWACVHEPELKGAYDALDGMVRTSQQAQRGSLDPQEVADAFGPRARWTHVVMVRTGQLRKLDGLARWIDRADLDAIQRRARQQGAFVYATAHKGKGPMFVFVGRDNDEMTRLTEQFRGFRKFREGVLVD